MEEANFVRKDLLKRGKETPAVEREEMSRNGGSRGQAQGSSGYNHIKARSYQDAMLGRVRLKYHSQKSKWDAE